MKHWQIHLTVAQTARLKLMALAAVVVVLLTPPSARAQTYTVLHSFTGSDGSTLLAGLIQDSAGNLYGTTNVGGAFGCGVVFKLDATNTESVLYSFQGGTDGCYPAGGVVLDAAGNLYGATGFGGGNTSCNGGCGVVFKLDPSGTETVLYRFTGADGSNPNSGVILDAAGNLYGTNQEGANTTCPFGCGSVFKIDATNTATVLYAFQGGRDGAVPWAGLIQDSAGNLYGTTIEGGGTRGMVCGSSGCGVVFKVDMAGTETVLHRFSGGLMKPNGEFPFAGLIHSSGYLYGTTQSGGITNSMCSEGCGTVYSLDPTGKHTVIYSFKGHSDGAFPIAALLRDSAGNLYGTTTQGGITNKRCASGCGTVFKVDASGTETVLHRFVGTDGSNPTAGLIQDSAGNLYGTTENGGASGKGVVFKLTP